MFRLLLLCVFLLLSFSLSLAQQTPSQSTHEGEPRQQQCSAALSQCQTSAPYRQCQQSHGCPSPSPSANHTNDCSEPCKDVLHECLTIIAPPHCLSSSTPSPPSPPLSSECLAVIEQCKSAAPYQKCLLEGGCVSTTNLNTEICRHAQSVCSHKVSSCVTFYYGPYDCEYVYKV